MIALRLAIRNLRRNKRRTALTVTGLMIGLIVMIVAYGMLDGLTDQATGAYIDYETAHLRGFPHGYLDDDLIRELDELIPNADSLRQRIVEDFEATATVRFNIQGQLIVGREEAFVTIVGVDPEIDRSVYETLNDVVRGESFNGREGMLVGRRLAKDLGLEVGDLATVFLRSAPGALNSRRLPVIGILNTGHPQVDGQQVYLTLQTARELALSPGSANEIALRLPGQKNADEARDRLRAAGFDLEWQTWEEAAEGFLGLMRLRRIIFGVVILILALIAAVAVSNTMIMAVHERTQEIGALRALGFERGLVSRLFLLEGLTIGLFASVLAIVLGSALVLWLNAVGISLEAYEDIDTGFPVSTAFYPALHVWNPIAALIFGLLISGISSWSAARRAARGEVVRALREGTL